MFTNNIGSYTVNEILDKESASHFIKLSNATKNVKLLSYHKNSRVIDIIQNYKDKHKIILIACIDKKGDLAALLYDYEESCFSFFNNEEDDFVSSSDLEKEVKRFNRDIKVFRIG